MEGGMTRSLEIDGQYWYQAVGDTLLVLDKRTGKAVGELQLANSQGAAFCRDLTFHKGCLWAILDGKDVLQIDISTQASPSIVNRISASELGILPHSFSSLQDSLVVLGDGGVVRVQDGEMLVSCEGSVTGLVYSIERGLLYAVDRRLFVGSSKEFLGSASLLAEFPSDANVDHGTLIFTRDLGNRTEVGLMTPEGREVDAFQGTKMLDGGSASIHIRKSRVHVCTSEGVYILGVSPTEIRLLKTIPMKGAKDVGVIASNYFAICGDQGRGMYRIADDKAGEGDTYFRESTASSSMGRGHANRFAIDIPTALGLVEYEYGGSIHPSNLHEILVDPNPERQVVLGWSATLNAETGDVVVRDFRNEIVKDLSVPKASTFTTIGGNFWFGTRDGIVVCGPDKAGCMTTLGTLQLAGPIIQIVGQLDGRAAFVSEAGIVGEVELISD